MRVITRPKFVQLVKMAILGHFTHIFLILSKDTNKKLKNLALNLHFRPSKIPPAPPRDLKISCRFHFWTPFYCKDASCLPKLHFLVKIQHLNLSKNSLFSQIHRIFLTTNSSCCIANFTSGCNFDVWSTKLQQQLSSIINIAIVSSIIIKYGFSNLWGRGTLGDCHALLECHMC